MAENPKKRRQFSGSIKINGRGNVVLYLVRQAAPKNPAAPTQAAGISTDKLTFTPLPLKRQYSKITTKQKAKIDIAIRKVKLTTKIPEAATTKRSTVKISTPRRATAKIKIATRKAAALKKSTIKKDFLKAIAKTTSKSTKTLVRKKVVNILDSSVKGKSIICMCLII